jgi:hypothetical protein
MALQFIIHKVLCFHIYNVETKSSPNAFTEIQQSVLRSYFWEDFENVD